MGEDKINFRIERDIVHLSKEEKKKYLFLNQVKTLDMFFERNAITKQQYEQSYNGLISKMRITEEELQDMAKNKSLASS